MHALCTSISSRVPRLTHYHKCSRLIGIVLCSRSQDVSQIVLRFKVRGSSSRLSKTYVTSLAIGGVNALLIVKSDAMQSSKNVLCSRAGECRTWHVCERTDCFYVPE